MSATNVKLKLTNKNGTPPSGHMFLWNRFDLCFGSGLPPHHQDSCLTHALPRLSLVKLGSNVSSFWRDNCFSLRHIPHLHLPMSHVAVRV